MSARTMLKRTMTYDRLTLILTKRPFDPLTFNLTFNHLTF